MKKLLICLGLVIPLSLSASTPPDFKSGVAKPPVITLAPSDSSVNPIVTIVALPAGAAAPAAVQTNNSAATASSMASNQHRRQSAPDIFEVDAKSRQENTQSQPSAGTATATAPITIRPSRSGSMTQRSPSPALTPKTYTAKYTMSPLGSSPILRPVATSPQSPVNLNLAADQSPRTVNRKTCALLLRGVKPTLASAVLSMHGAIKEVSAMQERAAFLNPEQVENMAKLNKNLKEIMHCLSSL